MENTKAIIHEPIWFSGQDPLSFPKHEGKTAVDVVVVGGGVTGLSAAYHLAKRGYSVALLEKNTIGSGATGASTGILNIEIDVDLAKFKKSRRLDRATAIREFSKEAIQYLDDFIHSKNIVCDFERTSMIKLVLKDCQRREVKSEVEFKQSLGFEIRFLNKEELQKRINVNALGALEELNDGIMNPYAFLRGLSLRLKEEGESFIYESSPLISYRQNSSKIEVQTADGEITCSHLVVAAGASDHDRGMAYPVRDVVIATERVGKDIREQILWKARESILDTRWIYNYGRITPDGRILFGGTDVTVTRGGRASKEQELKVARKLKLQLCTLFPQLKDIHITHVWSGTFGQTADDLPYCSVEGGVSKVIRVGGYGGSGLALGFLFGREIPNLIGDAPSPLLNLFGLDNRGFLFNVSKSKFIPKSLKYLGASIYIQHLKLRDFLCM